MTSATPPPCRHDRQQVSILKRAGSKRTHPAVFTIINSYLFDVETEANGPRDRYYSGRQQIWKYLDAKWFVFGVIAKQASHFVIDPLKYNESWLEPRTRQRLIFSYQHVTKKRLGVSSSNSSWVCCIHLCTNKIPLGNV